MGFQEKLMHMSRCGPILPFCDFPCKILIIAAMQYLFLTIGGPISSCYPNDVNNSCCSGVDVWSNFQDDRRNIISI